MSVNDPWKPIEWETAHWFRKWTYMLVNPMIERGCAQPLQYEDLMQLPSHELSGPLYEQLAAHYSKTSDSGDYGVPRLLKALGKANWYENIVVGLWSVAEGAVRIASPVVLRLLLQALQHPTDVQQSRDAYMYAGILGGLGIAQCIIHHVLFYYSMRLGQNFMIASTSLIFHNLFNLKVSGSRFTTGELVNFISNDVGRYEEFAVFASFIYCSILEVIAIFVILIFQLNVASACAAVAMTCFFIPIQLYIASRFAHYRTATAIATDQRVRFVSEVINGIASVKAYGWEKPFFKLITGFRKEELGHISQSQTLKAFNFGLYFFSPSLANFATFVVFWGTGGVLTLPIVFSTISLLQQLRTTMGRQWTRGVETYSEATSSSRRIDGFIHAVNSDNCAANDLEASKGAGQGVEMVSPSAQPGVDSDVLVEIKDKTYTYDPSDACEAQPSLAGVNLTVSKGELVVVVGAVGSGKTSLLAAMLGELNEVPPGGGRAVKAQQVLTQRHSTRLAYCQQRPWVLSGTVRTNIVIAGKFDNGKDDFKTPSYVDEDLYGKAVESCCLVTDLNNWPDYDSTEIGERGVSVSGGQKARIALARAIYSDSDLFLLDDPLSACDAKVGRSLFYDCILDTLRSTGKGVVLATHQLQYLPHADKVVVLHEGRQVFCGSYAELLRRQNDFPFLELSTGATDADHAEVDAEGKGKGEGEGGVESTVGGYDRHFLEKRGFREAARVVVEEEKKEGNVSLGLVLEYLRSGGPFMGSTALGVAVFSQALLMVTDYWLKWWAGNAFFDSQRSSEYVYIFAILTFACVLVGPLRAELFFRFHREASYAMSERCLWSLLHTPLLFFNSNPSGRILNRFSKDQNLTDESFPMVLFDFAENCFLFCLAAVILVVISIPWLIFIMPPLLYIFFLSRQKYIKCSREIKRLQALSRSPIYSDFSATLDGLTTLRAYKLESRITRSFHILLDRNSRVWFSFTMVSRWLGFRMDSKASLILIALVVLAVVLRNEVDTGLIGYAIVYTLSLSGLMQWCVRQSGEVESQFTSIERISAYGHLPPEDGYASSLSAYKEGVTAKDRTFSLDKILPPQMMKKRSSSIDSSTSSARGSRKNSTAASGGGRLELKNLTVRYRDGMEDVVSDLSMVVPSGAKIGVCGRTGSGKSTLLLALMRLNMISGGDMLLDDESLTGMDLETARSHISVIPQDPHLFSGTIRFNLDPFSVYSDADVWEALGNAHISEQVRADPLGLHAVVEENGKNFSVGQRQLFSLARAILRRCKVVLMDEVTASIDYATDRLIQKTIRECPSLRDATIVTVAHRLRSIADSDIIVVLRNGRLLETGKPVELLRSAGSEFRALVKDSDEFDDILAIATGAQNRI